MKVYLEDPEARAKIDGFLREIAKIECTLGIDSKEEEKKAAKEAKNKLHLKIKDIDEKYYDIIEGDEDQVRTPAMRDFFRKMFSADKIKESWDKGFLEWLRNIKSEDKPEEDSN